MGKFADKLGNRLNKKLKINFDGKQETVITRPRKDRYPMTTEKGEPHEKVIFLDIEGVIVTHRSIVMQFSKEKGEYYHGGEAGWHRFIDRAGLALVFKACVEHGAKIVVTSTLRGMPGLYSAMAVVCPHWIEEEDAFDLFIGDTGTGPSREEEIKAYVQAHDVKHWVAIDDRQLNLQNFVNINAANGITMQDYYDMCLLLCDPEKNEQVKPIPIFL